MTKRVILLEEGTAEMKGLMGSKGADLAELIHAGWSVPAGFVVTTECCREFCTRLGHLSGEGEEEIINAIRHLEQQTGKFFGHSENPLLLAVRTDQDRASATATRSLLNVGLNDITVEGLARQTGDRLYALQCYLDYLKEYGQLVYAIPSEFFTEISSHVKGRDETELELTITEFKYLIEGEGRNPFPQDVQLQFKEAVRAVYHSQRIKASRSQDEIMRKSYYISSEQSAPVLIQTMIHGKCGESSGAGTIYKCNPLTGEKGITGQYVPTGNASQTDHGLERLRNDEPELYTSLLEIGSQLETHKGEVQEITFVIESGALYVVQTQPARLSSTATLRSTVDFVHEGLLTKEDALLRIQPAHITEVQKLYTNPTSNSEASNGHLPIQIQSVTNDECPAYNNSDSLLSADLQLLLNWADEVKELKVLANVDHPQDAMTARLQGAEGIGLCRTEHMLLSPARLPFVQKMILADTESERRRGLERLLPMQQSDFEQIFEAMDGYQVTIRLLDSPLHELLPDLGMLEKRREWLQAEEWQEQIDHQIELEELERVIRRVCELHEHNPTLGQQACRLSTVFPEIVDMQLEAIFRAAVKGIRQGWWVRPEIMIPQIGHVHELQVMRDLVDHVADQVLGEEKRHCLYRVGAMIEAPRAALTATHIARQADFFSFGTDELTEMTFGYSRHEAEKRLLLLQRDTDSRPVTNNPFHVLDIEGVGQLIEMAVVQGRIRKPHLKTGICGENVVDLESITFCHRIGLDYVSCLPEQIPYARIAAAQAAIKGQREGADTQNTDISTIA
ncbi:putative PEP-binding protein [Paenibacillus sp. BGI2013]|uniref:putative PEP-binding protein n=1 Tax=Paenibacillus sp. BGI2013 TaxID=2058902 RepID=UPI0015D5F255|nr:putative PEP-binding protein [Paenibacillus sp. BGI2013]